MRSVGSSSAQCLLGRGACPNVGRGGGNGWTRACSRDRGTAFFGFSFPAPKRRLHFAARKFHVPRFAGAGPAKWNQTDSSPCLPFNEYDTCNKAPRSETAAA